MLCHRVDFYCVCAFHNLRNIVPITDLELKSIDSGLSSFVFKLQLIYAVSFCVY